MKSNYRQDTHPVMVARLLTVLAAVVMFAAALVPAQAQTTAFPEPTTFLSAPAPDTSSSTVAVATGDFNGDGKLDTVNIDSGSRLNLILGNGDGTFQTPITLNIAASNFFPQAIAVGDFNDDHHSDVLFQNTSSGQVTIWEMEGNTLIGGGPVSPNPGPAWQAIGTGDFNHDGFSDILFQNASTGQVSIWEMNGNKLIGGGPVSPNPGTSWHAIGTDGGSDILFQNTSGQASIWDMSGNTLIGGGPVRPSPGPSWRAVDLT